jgi:putative tricarboxylic transport membrane protein
VVEGFIGGLVILFDPITLLVIFVGTAISLIFGIIPGLSGTVSMALLLPFVYKLPEEIALPFLLSLACSGLTGGSMTAILMNVPGTMGNAATLLDGFPMTQKGESGRAIGAAITASTLGGIVSVPMSILMMIPLLPVILAFRSPELFTLVLMGVSFVGVLGSGSIPKGLISGGLGLMSSFIGFHALTGDDRFTFGSVFLYDGLGLIPVALGLFAMAELVDILARKKTTITEAKLRGEMRDLLQGVKDVYIHKWLWLRSCVIGHIVGIIPGVGSEVSSWIAYGQAKQISKHREEFGRGHIEGVIAPESANNAKEGGALLTTMAFGIPGSVSMAIFLGGLLLVGVTPGPQMMTEKLDLAFALLLGIVVASIMGGVIAFFGARYLVKVVKVHVDFIFVAIVAISFVAAFSVTKNVLSTIVVIAISVLGIFLKRLGYSRPAFLLGFVLGPLFERYFFHALQMHGPFFFMRPLSLTIIGLTLLLYCYPYLGKAYAHLFRSEREI